MWCSKMAARWKGKDGDLNASKRDFPTSNTRNEGVLRQHDVDVIEMDEQSCMDHSILAIFEDSPVTSEDKNAVEEESETLLSALTEMLDSVEDDDGTLSPFDTLPDTKLLSHAERRDNSVELSLVERLRSRSKSTDVKCAIKIEVDKEDESKRGRKSPPKMFKHQSGLSKNKKAEAEVEVFTSSSLVNLVRIMHSYCLRLHVEEEEEEGDRGRRDHTLFSQGEVWKYERPSEESDEEINVVSDDEVTVKGAEKKDEEGDGKVMKSLLSNGNSSKTPAAREKKRVSFGPVQVASFDESEEMVLNEKILKDQIVSKALENPAGLSLKQQNLTSDVNKADVCPPKGEPKAKSLSLQQYRQLRQKRQPLVETQGNNTTKWPSVPEPPKELTPIFCLHGPVQINCGPKAVQLHPDVQSNDADHVHGAQHPVYKTHHASAPARPHPSETKPSTRQCGSGLKRSRSESTSPASLLQSVSANINVNVHDSKRSPVKKRTTVCIDPPNPVLLPLPFTQTTSPSTEDSSSGSKAELLNRDSNPPSPRSIQEIQNESSGTSPQRQPSSMKPKPDIEILNKCTELASAVSCRPPALCQATTQIQPSSGEKTPQPQKCIKPKTTLSAGLILAPTDVPSTETLAEVPSRESPLKEPSPPLQFDCRVQSASADAGIEAADVTSLLEQFEETQAKEERVESRLDIATSPPNLQTHGNLNETALAPPVGTHQGLSSSDSALWNLPNLQTSESVAIPEALGTEIILSTEQALPARRKNPPPKAIQIIDPRPLPSKKTQANLPEFPAAHMYSYISSDHDYCGLDRSPSQGRRLSVIEDDESQVTTHVAECNSLTSTITDANTSAKSVTQHPPEEPGARSESIPPTDKLTSLPDRSATVKDCISGAEDRTPPCTLPTPPPSPPLRGRQKRRYRRRSPLSSSSSCSSSSSSSSSSSASRSPKRQKRRHKRSESSSCSSSCSRSISRSPPRRSRWSYSRSRCSRSRSRSWSESWSRSRSPPRSKSPSQRVCHRRDVYSSRESRRIRREHEIRIQKLKAIDERRVVYVGRIYKSMTHDELRERFSQFGEVECVSLHFRDKGDHYGFVTFYNTDDAFAAIDNGGKLRKADELPFEICFGGRRQFCNSDYADLDANKDVEPSPAKNRFEDLDFDSLLKQAQKGLKR